ncbi:peptidase M3A and M3B thimet/oligopeptidase F [Candidatus Fermentibacteria bacterium]|nr:MAG: peptidase M3A and M3B thimet/oligopeptidase F [Candidatus Fermentibacteria bacterium]
MQHSEELSKIADALQELETEYEKRTWTQYTTGFDFGVATAFENYVSLLKNKEHWLVIRQILEKNRDPLLAREAKILENHFKPFHQSESISRLSVEIQNLSTKLSSVLNSFRYTVNGREMTSPDIANILSTNPDRNLRKTAFLSRNQISRPLVEAGFLDLVKLRKQLASEMGAATFVEYSLKEQELDPDMFSSWQGELSHILPLMQKTRAEIAGRYTGEQAVMPWDEAFIASSIAPELNAPVNMSDFLKPVGALFQKFGFDISAMNITYDVFPRKNKSEWGYNFTIQNGIDSRILANVKDRFSEFGVLLHETGHAVHSFTVNPDEIILNMGISGIVSEGIANLFGSFRVREEFYSPFFTENTETARQHFSELNRWTRASQLYALGRIFFDQKLYTTDLETLDDINNLFWENRQSLFGEEPYADQPVWANTIHYTTHPIYLHNYLLGDLTCDMLEEVFLRRESVSAITQNPEAFGRFITDEVVKPSGRYPFPELFRRISGGELSLSFLTRKIRDTLM